MKRIKVLLAALAVMAGALFVGAGPALAYDHRYQIPSDGGTHAVVGSEPTLENAGDEGCHRTGFYGASGLGGSQRIVYCAWFGVDNNSNGGGSYSNFLVYALKFRCFNAYDTAVQCQSFSANIVLGFSLKSSGTTNHNSRYVSCTAGGSSRCLGYSGSGTYTNNTGWIDCSGATGCGVVSSKSTSDIWDYVRSATSSETFDGVATGGAGTDVWGIYDN